jgi:hypothetical protein
MLRRSQWLTESSSLIIPMSHFVYAMHCSRSLLRSTFGLQSLSMRGALDANNPRIVIFYTLRQITPA